MSLPALFIGVVSHDGSRFSLSQGPQGLAYRLSGAISGTEVAVNTRDLFDETGAQVGPGDVQASLTAELEVEKRWNAFLERPLGASSVIEPFARNVKRQWRRVSPPSPTTVRRLLNIELSHLDLLRRGLASQAPWVLIVEDDGWASDIADLAGGLEHLMKTASRWGDVGYVNLSASFSSSELGINHLLQPADLSWGGSSPRAILGTSLPVTNTVCAILYSADFLATLVEIMDTLPVKPVVPIDWKLNLALMSLSEAGQTRETTCLFVEPAPIVQLSMQPTGILPE